jgi:hypothetical protein
MREVVGEVEEGQEQEQEQEWSEAEAEPEVEVEVGECNRWVLLLWIAL